MKKLKIFSLAMLCILVHLSCNKPKSRTEKFQLVLEHYSKNPEDSLKLKAARFLIENLDGLHTLDTTSVEENQVYFDLIRNTWKREKMRVGFRFPTLTRVIDSINKADKLPQTPSNAAYLNDADVVNPDFLIKNIDDAFFVWHNMPWAKKISFNDFCEYILPYRISNTYSADARAFFIKKYEHLRDSVKHTDNPFIAANFIVNDISKWFYEDPNTINRYPYLQPIKFSNLLKGRVGDCEDAHSLRITAFRALGIPAVMDEIPNWGNSNLKHFWYKIIDPVHDTVLTKITNENTKISTAHIISASTFDIQDYHEYPKKIEVKYGRTVPKVYRRCFAKQLTSLAAIKNPNDEVPPYFENSHIKDVTHQYLETTDVNLSIKNKISGQKFVYLCVFDNENWIPVAWSRVINSTAEFKSLGKGIVYLPAFYIGQSLVPAANPFLLDVGGKKTVITPSIKKGDIRLYAKFPVRSYVLENEHHVVGGRFQFANKQDLSDTITVHKITHTPFYETQIKVNDDKKYQFLIFQFKNIPITHMSELRFYGINSKGEETQLTGTYIGSKGSYPYNSNRLFDGNRTTYFTSAKDDPFSYVGIDLGKNKASKITKIVYNPHSDDNSIFHDDRYQLFYWNNQWIPIGLEIAGKDNTVKFRNVPKNSLLLVKNVAGGKEQRIFRYVNGMQQFW